MIPSFSLKRQLEQHGDSFTEAMGRALWSGNYILGKEVEDFEKEVATYLEVSHAIGVASGSDALLLALMALGIGEGDEVITTPFTFFATAGAVARLGARPVFVDVDEKSMNLNPELIKDAITPQTKAVIVVHLFGLPARMRRVMEVCETHGLPVIEDSAQGVGAYFTNRHVGTIGHIGTFSFFPTKNLGAAGDGGLVVTNDKVTANIIRQLRVHGASRKYYHERLGINSRLDAVQAALLRAKLPLLDGWLDDRRRIAKAYIDGLSGIPGIRLPSQDQDSVHAWHQFTIRTSLRDDLSSFLDANGVGSTVYYPTPLNLQPCFEDAAAGDCPVAEHLSKQVLSLPMFPELTLEEVSRVCNLVRKFFEQQ